jgi:hypothetical protein
LIAAWPEVLTELENQRDEPAGVTMAELRQQLAELTARLGRAEETIAALGRQADLVTQSLTAVNNQLQATTGALAASAELAASAQHRADELATTDMAQLGAYVRTHPHSFPIGIKVRRATDGGWQDPKSKDILSGSYYEPASVDKFLAELDRALDNYQSNTHHRWPA